jgi:phage terminase large subunit-like protein
MHDKLTLLAIVLGVIASILGVRAAMTEIRDNQDAFIADLKKQGRRTSLAAISAAASSLVLAIDFLFFAK